jgi:hypothetical protein
MCEPALQQVIIELVKKFMRFGWDEERIIHEIEAEWDKLADEP